MSKEEICLELTKIAYTQERSLNEVYKISEKPSEIITELYNYIYENIKVPGDN